MTPTDNTAHGVVMNQAADMGLEGLLARVKAATGPDRLIDADLCQRFHLTTPRPALPTDFDGKYGYAPGNMKTEHGFLQAHNYTASIDAALALVERVLPGCRVHSMQQHAEYWTFSVRLPSAHGTPPSVWASAATPSLAILASLISALISTGAN